MMKRILSGNPPWWVVPLGFLAVAAGALGFAYPPGSVLVGGDWGISAYPMFRFNMEVFAREGVLPLWNPFILGGMTHLASFNVWALYPTELLALPFGPRPETFYWCDSVLHLMLAGWGMWWFLRGRVPGMAGAVLGALVYMLGGRLFTLAGAGHMSWVRSYAGFPWVAGLVATGLRAGGYRHFVMAGAVQALSLIATGIQFTMQAGLLVGVWTLFRGSGSVVRRCTQLAVFAAVAGALSAGVWFPGFEHFAQSVRADPASMAGQAGMFNLTAAETADWLLPGIWGAWPRYWGPQEFGAASDYFGLVPLALAVVAILVRGRALMRWLLLGAAGLVLAMGPATPLGAFIQELPVLSGFRAGLRWLFYPFLAGSVLAAHGWTVLAGPDGRRLAARTAGAFLLFAVACGVVAGREDWQGAMVYKRGFVRERVMARKVDPRFISAGVSDALWRGALAGGAAGAAVGALLVPGLVPGVAAALLGVHAVADLATAGSPYFRSIPGGADRPDEVVEAIRKLESRSGRGGRFRVATNEYPPLANIRMHYGLEWVGGYHSLPLLRYEKLYEAGFLAPSASVQSLLGVRYAVAAGRPPRFAVNPGALPRAFLASSSVPVPGLEGALAVMRGTKWTPHIAPVEGAGTARSFARGGTVELEWGRDEMEAKVAVGGASLLVVADTWYPAWKAFVDGVRVPILRAYGALRAVEVPAGAHTVGMRYDSWRLKAGLFCSAVAWAALLATGAGRRRREEPA